MSTSTIVIGLIILTLASLITYGIFKFDSFCRNIDDEIKEEREQKARDLAASKSRAVEHITRLTAANKIEGRGIFHVDALTMGLSESMIYLELEAFAEKVFQIPASKFQEPEYIALTILQPGDSVRVRVDEETNTLWSIYRVTKD